ncbi:MAG: hypothetical protein KUF82_00870 [Candidatus Thiodiazotropha sp. (ex Ctena orbiculata)]|nr:hypothetical protein [Candidatus Thiodiazotropha taylori]
MPIPKPCFYPTRQKSIPLLPEAAGLAIRRQGREICHSPIGQPPKLSVTWPKGHLQRGKRHTLELKLSKSANPEEALQYWHSSWRGRCRTQASLSLTAPTARR